MNNDILLSLKNVSFGYNDEDVLCDINLNIKRGEFIGIVGLNGSGKSTLLKLILGVNKPTSGEVLLAPGIRMGYVNQTISTEEGGFPATIFEIVSLGLRKKPFSRLFRNAIPKISVFDFFGIYIIILSLDNRTLNISFIL